MIDCGDCVKLPLCRNSKHEGVEVCKEFLQMTDKQRIQRIRHSTFYKKKENDE